jgi:hypothetical protein
LRRRGALPPFGAARTLERAVRQSRETDWLIAGFLPALPLQRRVVSPYWQQVDDSTVESHMPSIL